MARRKKRPPIGPDRLRVKLGNGRPLRPSWDRYEPCPNCGDRHDPGSTCVQCDDRAREPMVRRKADTSATIDDGFGQAVGALRRVDSMHWRWKVLSMQFDYFADVAESITGRLFDGKPHPSDPAVHNLANDYMCRILGEMKRLHREINSIYPVGRSYMTRIARASKRAARTRAGRSENIRARWRAFIERVYAPIDMPTEFDYVREFLDRLHVAE